ncbi:MAG: phosphotransferase family protein [Cyclobacteriaceae bacterium]|nr:phosphotransferase family protein [Cyclobacteriaceae bacterium]
MEHVKPDQPVEARQHEVPDVRKLNAWLKSVAPHFGEVLSIEQFPSGYSNLTFCLKTATQEYILRRPPIGANIKSAHDMGREFMVLTRLKPHFGKIPSPIIYGEDESVIGAPFYIMQRLQGVILRASHAQQLKLSPEIFKSISEALVDTLVELHSIDIVKTGLDQLGKPEGYVQRQVEGWIKRYYAAETDSLEHMNQLAAWLKQQQPVSQQPTFLHNDFKYDNVILDPNNLSHIIGVLDWEMATVGDPLMDLGASLAYWSEATDTSILQSFNLTVLPGNLTRQQVVNRYEEKSSRDISGIHFYYVFGLFKNAVIAQQIYARWKQGFSKDPRFGGLIHVIKALANQGVKSLETQNL